VSGPESHPKRPHGTGTLHELSPGLWRLRVYVGRDVVTGRSIQRSRQFTGTRAGAEKALRQFHSELDQAPTAKRLVSKRILLNEVVDAHLAASTELAPGTRRGYASLHKNHVSTGIGKERVDAITATAMRRYYAGLAETKGLKPASIWSVYSLISGALRRASREHGLVFDFNQLVTPPKPIAEKQQMATDEELSRLFKVADQLGEDWPLLFRLACATGMRRGELVALRWTSMDDTGRLYVDKAIADEKGGLIEKTPKNGFPRYVQVDDETVRWWEHEKQRVTEQLAAIGVPFSDERFVFSATPEGTTPKRPDRISNVWDTIRTNAELNASLEFRALRNWHVTILDDELGFELAKIGRRVGHSRSSGTATGMTARYSLSDKKVDRQMADGVAEKLATIRPTGPSSV
jgi:integrase